MDCKDFKEYLPEFLEEELSSHLMQYMQEHIKDCKECRIIYNKKRLAREGFKSLNHNEEFRSQRSEIMKKIDKNKYSNTITSRMKYSIFANKKAIAMAASLVFILSITPLVYKNLSTKEAKSGNAAFNKESAKVDEAKPQMKGGDMGIAAIDPNQDTSNKSSLSSKRNPVAEELNNLKNQNLGIGPWKVIHSSKDNIVFYNYSHVLAYNYSGGEGGMYSAINLKNFEVGGYEGSAVADFNVSPDGSHMIMGTSNGDEHEKNKPLYMINLLNGSSEKLFDSINMIPTRVEWSNNSRFVLIQGEQDLLVYDTEESTQYRKKETSSDKFFIGENGDYISSKGELYSKANNYSKTNSYNINVIGFGDNYVIQKEGSKIYVNDFKTKQLIKDVGAAEYLGIRDRKIILSDSKENNYVLNIDSKKIYKYSTDEIYRLSEEGNKLIDINNSNMEAGKIKLLIGDEKGDTKKDLKLEGLSYTYGNFKGEDKIVVVKFNENAKTLADFKIIEYDINSLKANILYENK